MSLENVEQSQRATDAYNRRDLEALLEELDPDIEWRSGFSILLGGKTTVYRGHDGVREWFRELDEALAEIEVVSTEIRDLEDRVIAIGYIRTRGNKSGAVTESPLATVSEFRNGKMVRLQSYLDPAEALDAAGLQE